MQEFLKKEGMVRMVNDIDDAGNGQPSTTGEYAIGIGTDGEPNKNVAFHGVPMPHILGQPARSVNLGKVVYSIYQTMVYASPSHKHFCGLATGPCPWGKVAGDLYFWQ